MAQDKPYKITNGEETRLWVDYQNGLAYQSACGIATTIPRAVRFFEGDQWPTPTEKTKNMPRPVFNIVRFICRNKKAAILSTPIRIQYKADIEDADLTKWNRFAWYVQKEIRQEELDKLAIEDAVKKGTYVYHYYWDAEAKGKNATERGGLRCEIIDPMHVFFADPTQKDEQKQAWILISSREPVASVRAKADPDVEASLIVPDEDDADKYGTTEQDGSKLCTVLTRYFRLNGEVYIEKATRSVIVNKPFPLAPDVDAALAGIEAAQAGERKPWEKPKIGRPKKKPECAEGRVDAPNNDTPDEAEEAGSALTWEGVKAPLYPIVVGSYESRENSIFGIGEADGLIPNQKIINFLMAMSVLNVQEVAWGKYLVMPGALQGQKINNDPGQVIVDHTGTGQGIRKLTEQAIQSFPVTLVDSIMGLTRTVAGATEVMTGETIGANMSGAAIASLQSQAAQPIEELRNAFWQVKVKQGRVMAQFYKLFYEGVPVPEGAFNGSDFIGREYEVAVEVTGTARASVTSDVEALNSLLEKGAISPAAYVTAYPDEVLSNKQVLLDSIKADEGKEAARLSREIEKLRTELAEARKKLSEGEKTVDSVRTVIAENKALKALCAEMAAGKAGGKAAAKEADQEPIRQAGKSSLTGERR